MPFRISSIILALIYLLTLWYWQFTKTPLDKYLAPSLRPIASVMYTNNQYRMYAPSVQSTAPFLYFLFHFEDRPGTGPRDRPLFLDSFPAFAEKKWVYFFLSLGYSLFQGWDGETSIETEGGRVIFTRLAAMTCRKNTDGLLRSVELRGSDVHYGRFREKPVREPSQRLALYDCANKTTEWGEPKP